MPNGRLFIYLLAGISLVTPGYAQYQKQIDSLCMNCMRPGTDSEKIVRMDKLAEAYYIYKLNTKGDSILNDELLIAETSSEPNLKFTALFGDAILNLGTFTSSEHFNNAIAFLKNGIEYASSQNNYNYLGMGYSRLSGIYRKRGIPDSALQYAKMALESLAYLSSDSLKAEIYIELGNAYADNGQMVLACKNYNSAFDFALHINSVPLQGEVYHDIAEVYYRLNQDEEASEEIQRSLEIDQESKYTKGLARDYFDLARYSDSSMHDLVMTYIQRALNAASAINDHYYLLSAKQLMLSYIEVIEHNSSKALTYIENEKDLKAAYINAGLSMYNLTIGNIYLYGGKPDSAVQYFKMAENDIVSNFDQELKVDLFYDDGMLYQRLHNWPEAINYYKKAFELYKKQNDVTSLADISDSLSFLYGQQGDYREAYKYSILAMGFKNDLDKNSKLNSIALLDVVRENRKADEERRLHNLKMNRQRNIQYMFITIVICVAFIVMLTLGAFPVSKTTIRMVGYFFFISLFEFLVMLIDNHFLDTPVHSQPLTLWLIKIGLIACLVPIQHVMEHNLIKFLQSRKLLDARTKFSFKRTWKKLFPSSEPGEEEIEKDTALL